MAVNNADSACYAHAVTLRSEFFFVLSKRALRLLILCVFDMPGPRLRVGDESAKIVGMGVAIERPLMKPLNAWIPYIEIFGARPLRF